MATANLENSASIFHEDRNLIAGRYRMHTRIGRGRLGEIFTAIDEGDEEPGVEQFLAIQSIPEDIVRNNKLFNKINLGYSILQAAAHPNIVNFRHFGRDGKFGYLVMDLLDGVSLRLVLDETEKLTLDEAKPVIHSVGEALRLLHAKDMVHGNLTTSNVFITDELEVRLLDVLPLDSAEPIVRDAATSEDDVFGLACLAYEMLAGKHPFKNNSPAEADRIASLSDSEWSALRRALSFDRGQRTSSIADFMRDFGIRGTERIRPTVDQPARQESVVYPTVAAVDADPWNEEWPPTAEPIQEKARPLRAIFLVMLLAGLSAWSYNGQPDENIANLISYVDELSTPAATVEVMRADVEMIEEIVVTEAQPTVQPAPAAPMQTESELLGIESFVSVSERDGAARIAPPRIENSTIPLIWWTSGHTANADTDFISVEQQTMADTSIGDGNMLYVPLVNDNLPEAAESFFVHFGHRNTQQGQLERIATVRVDIVDDD